jgi:hypothetical protein
MRVRDIAAAIVAVLLLASCGSGARPSGSADRSGSASSTLEGDAAANSAASVGKWVPVSGGDAPVLGSSASVAGGGHVLLLNASTGCPPGPGAAGFTPAAVYNPDTHAIAALRPPDRLLDGTTMATLADGRVLLAGGDTASGLPSPQALIWNPATGTWANAARMTMARSRPVTAALRDGRVLVVAGETIDVTEGQDGSTPTRTAELYDPATNVWIRTASVPMEDDPRFAVVLTQGKVLVLPETGSGGDIENAAMYDPGHGVWLAVAPPEHVLQVAALLALGDGSALVFDIRGGVARFEPESGWSPNGTLATPRGQAGIALLPDGRVLVAGGVHEDGATDDFLKTAELYDPANGKSSNAAPLLVARFGDIAIALPDGSVLLAGGAEAHESPPGQTAAPQTPAPTVGGEDGENEDDMTDPPCPPTTSPALRWIP